MKRVVFSLLVVAATSGAPAARADAEMRTLDCFGTLDRGVVTTPGSGT